MCLEKGRKVPREGTRLGVEPSPEKGVDQTYHGIRHVSRTWGLNPASRFEGGSIPAPLGRGPDVSW